MRLQPQLTNMHAVHAGDPPGACDASMHNGTKYYLRNINMIGSLPRVACSAGP